MGPRNHAYTAVAVGKEQEHEQEEYDKDREAHFSEESEQEEADEEGCTERRRNPINTSEESATAGLLARERKNHHHHSSPKGKRRRRQDTSGMWQRPSLWGRLLGWKMGDGDRSMVQVGRGGAEVGESIRLGGDTERRRFLIDEYPNKRSQRRRGCFVFGLALLVILGFIQSITLLTSLLHTIFPSSLDQILSHWGQPHHPGYGLTSYPTDFSRDILPLPLHSHNDYWRRVPLYDAIKAGAIGVEADVWFIDGELYVGHTMAALTRNRTLKSLYVDPLRRILEGQNDRVRVGGGGGGSGSGDDDNEDPERQARGGWNGVFDTKLEQSLTLLIDFKDKKPKTFQRVLDALQPLRERGWLSHVNGSQRVEGPITVVATGDARFEDILDGNPHHDIFFDAPLDSFWDTDSEGPKPLNISSTSSSSSSTSSSKYTPLNSHYASTSFPKAIGYPWKGSITASQMKIIRAQVKGAQKAGLKARYWDTPFWPISLRNNIWEQLVEEGGVDILNVDDLKAAAKKDWGKGGSKWWKRSEGGST